MNPCSPLWTVPDACAYLKICKAHFYALIRNDAAFPRPIRLGQTVRYRAADFESYVASKLESNGMVGGVDAQQKRGRGRPRKTGGTQ